MLKKLGRGWAKAIRYLNFSSRIPYSVKTATLITVTWSIATVITGSAIAMDLILFEPGWLTAWNIVWLIVDLTGLRFGLRKLAEAKERRRFAAIIVEGFMTSTRRGKPNE